MGARARERERPRPNMDHAQSPDLTGSSNQRFLSDRLEQRQDIFAEGLTYNKVQGVH